MQRFNTFLLEKSSLTPLGVPNDVMQEIQINYEIDSNATWSKVVYKKDLINDLKIDQKALYIEISKRYIRLIIQNNSIYYVQYFRYEKDNWGSYEIREREEISRTQLKYSIQVQSNIYKLDSDNFQLKKKTQRIVQKELKEFDETTQDFKYYILKNFNTIISRLYGSRHHRVMKQIARNLEKIKNNLNADDLLKFLADNKKLAEIAKEYENAKEDKDLLKLKNLEKKYNSLPVLDEYLITFEELYSDKFNHRVNVKDLIETFGKMKIETAFMYYLYTGRMKNLTIQNKK